MRHESYGRRTTDVAVCSQPKGEFVRSDTDSLRSNMSNLCSEITLCYCRASLFRILKYPASVLSLSVPHLFLTTDVAIVYLSDTLFIGEPEYCCRYSDWLRAGRSRGRSSSLSTVKNFDFSTSSRPALLPTQPPIQWIPGSLSPGVKRPGREDGQSPPASANVKNVDLYIHSPIRLHCIARN
jgi:hypothetical protein